MLHSEAYTIMVDNLYPLELELFKRELASARTPTIIRPGLAAVLEAAAQAAGEWLTSQKKESER
jgi:hypothetical protein